MVTTAAPWTTWMSLTSLKLREQQAKDQRAHRHAEQQHREQKRDDARARALGREVGRQREADRLHRVQAGADQKERQRRGGLRRSMIGPVVSPERMSSAKGMMAKPPNCSSVPNQM